MSQNMFQHYMSDNEIIAFINDYIDKSSYNFAVLIDGAWGCGKTYFIKEKLTLGIKQNEEVKAREIEGYKEKEIIYISLYGVSKKEDITSKIVVETLPFKNLLKSKGFGLASSLGKTLIGGLLSTQGVSLPGNPIDLSNFVSLEKCILIIDDLERCNMNINEVLGYINEFVEHDGIKTIIVANEKEIAAMNRVQNKELKYIVALSDKIDYPPDSTDEKSSITNRNAAKKDSEQKVSVDRLIKKVNSLFGEDELYKQIKEKLIGVTINYDPEVSSVIEDVVNRGNFFEDIKHVIIENKEFIAERFVYYDHHNIRTLLFCFDKFRTIYENLKDVLQPKYAKTIFNLMFQNAVVVSIMIKTGKVLSSWKAESDIELFSIDGNVYDPNSYIKRFKFVEEFFLGASFSKDRAIDIINRYIEIQRTQINDPDDPLYILKFSWWLLDDAKATDLLININMSLVESPEKYCVSNYLDIIALNITFQRIGLFQGELDNVMNTMKSNLKNTDTAYEFNVFGWTHSNFDDKEDTTLYERCINELQTHLETIQKEKSLDKLNSIFDDSDGWAEKLLDYARENENKILSQRAFISKINYDVLLRAVRTASINSISTFRGLLMQVIYRFNNIKDFYVADKETIDVLSTKISQYYDEIKATQKIRAQNIKYLINDLKRLSERLT